ncbi:MAG: agmatinase [Alphaproteobacteria bacterium]
MSDSRTDHAFTATSLYGIREEPSYAGALSFMRRKYTHELDGVDVAVTGLPLDLATSNRPGARFGPAGIRAASVNLAWRGACWPTGLDPFERLAVIDYGDCYFDFGRPDGIVEAIEAHAKTIIEAGASLLSLGGDHFVSYPLLRAHCAKHGPLALVHFDAHSDSWREDGKRVDHGTMFFHAAEEGLIDPARSVQLGIRTHNDETHGFTILGADWVHENGTGAALSEIERIVGGSKAYLTFDIDCLDPSFAPGTGTPVCGGLSTAQALSLMRGLGAIDFVGMDLVEVAPIYDSGEITALAGASIALEYLVLLARKKG